MERLARTKGFPSIKFSLDSSFDSDRAVLVTGMVFTLIDNLFLLEASNFIFWDAQQLIQHIIIMFT